MPNSSFQTLITERLFLRELLPQDANEIFQLRSSEEVNQFIDRPKAVTIDDAAEFISKIQALTKTNGSMMWAITLAGGARLIGTVVYWNVVEEKGEAELGYELLPKYQGKGIMIEAVKKVIEFGFGELKFKKIVAEPKKGNVRSIKLLEDLGFGLSGEIDGGYLIYELTDIDHPL